jgi:hypothetical protein
VGPESLVWITVPGTRVTLQLMKGWPATVMGAYAADYNAFVEPLRDADSAGYTPSNSVATSNHLNGTAMDLCWGSHTFRVSFAGYSPAMIATMEQLEQFYEGIMFWAQRWDDPKDAMHHQMGYGTWNNPKVADFIARKIRPDGFSTFRRGGTSGPPAPALSRADRYALAIIAEGQRLGITPRGIIIGLSVALVETNLTMYANSNDPPSLALPHDKVGSDHMSSGLFQQQTSWGTLADRMDPAASARIFFTVDNGGGVRGLTRIRDGLGQIYDYNSTAHSMGFYAQKVQGSAYPDRYDERMAEATALFNRLAGTAPAPPPRDEDDFMSALSPDEQRALYNAVMSPQQSRSPLRHVGEGTVGDAPDQVWDTDGSVHVLLMYLTGVILGDPDAVQLLREVAAVNTVRYPDRVHDRCLAQAMLNVIEGTATTDSAPATGQTPGTAPAPVNVYVPPPQWTAPAPPVYVQPALTAAQSPPSAVEGGLFGEIQALSAKLHAVSDMVTEVTEGQ